MELLMQAYNYPSQFEYVSGQTPWTNWTYPAVIGAVYMTTILTLRAIMKNAPNRIEARFFAAVHNFNMFALSVVCFFGIGYGTVKLGWVRNRVPKTARFFSVVVQTAACLLPLRVLC